MPVNKPKKERLANFQIRMKQETLDELAEIGMGIAVGTLIRTLVERKLAESKANGTNILN